jgi:hypothetical protein
MNLPVLSQLNETQSTYITFSKSLLDLDKAVTDNTPCYFSKMVALNLPLWENPEFFIDLTSVGVVSTNPNLVVPKAIQYYMENIIRQSVGINDVEIPEITELAFWKTMEKFGLIESSRKSMVTFINTIATSNFITTESNNGWAEIVCQIPNKCKSLTTAWKTLSNIKNTVQADDTDTALYDNGLKQILFTEQTKQVIDFENCVYSDVEVKDFDFNVLLLFYKDASGIEKLHGINFIYPFENLVSYWKLPVFTQKTNVMGTIGYQFKFNQKSCTNNATQIIVYELQENSHYDTFLETLSKLNSFLELKMRESNSEII